MTRACPRESGDQSQSGLRTSHPGWLLEAARKRRPRGMAVTRLVPAQAGSTALQNPAYRPADDVRGLGGKTAGPSPFCPLTFLSGVTVHQDKFVLWWTRKSLARSKDVDKRDRFIPLQDEAKARGLGFRAEKWRGKGGHMMVWIGNRVTTVPAREIDPKTARKIRKALGLAG